MKPISMPEFDSGRFEERRSGRDRRKPPVFPPEFSSRRRRKSCGRRKTDRGGYIDIYDSRAWALSIGVLGLSLFDAVMTALQMGAGRVTEANPILRNVIHWGGFYTFFSVKAAMTAFPLAIIILHKEWRLARFVARLCLGSYVLIALYHLYLVLLH